VQDLPGDRTTPERFPSAATRSVLLPVIATKFLTLLLIACAALVYPAYFNDARYVAVYRGNHAQAPHERPSADIVFRTWDAEHYLELAAHGYSRAGPQNAYYPLYPLLVRACAPLFGGDLLATAIVLSTLFGVLALLVIHDYCVRRGSVRMAHITVALLCAQPSAFFSVLPYSESLFLLLLGLFFAALWREQLLFAGVLGALLAMTRAIGVFCCAPLCVVLWRERRSLWRYSAPFGPLLGWAAYFACVYWQTGDPWLGFTVQKRFVTAPSIARLFDPLGFVREFLQVQGLHTTKGSLLERVWFVGYVSGLWALSRRARTRDADWLAVSAPFGLIPAISTQLMSFTRYLSVIFPWWCVVAEALAPRARCVVLFGVLGTLAGTQLWLLFRHVTFRWAG
jgi:hypothetical protein